MKDRVYRMTARAASTEQTATRIVDAMLRRFGELPYDQIRLDDVAAEAGVTVQTVIRRFRNKAGLMRATVEREQGRVAASREAGSGQAPAETIRDLVTHYETYGALILKVYSEAGMVEGLPELAAAGRAYHLDWCRRAFEDHLDPAADAQTRHRRLAQVTAACDATTWRILREDAGLDPEQTRLALLEVVTPLLGS
jgi:AcrR family transcriptional regulator